AGLATPSPPPPGRAVQAETMSRAPGPPEAGPPRPSLDRERRGKRPALLPPPEYPMAAARDDALDVLTALIAKAKRLGADAADAVLFEGASISHARRLGKTEKLERSEGYDLGLRVFFGKRQATVSSNDRTPAALEALAERAIAMARVVPEDPYCGIAAPEELARDIPALDISDPAEPTIETLIERAAAAEEAARAVPGITNSEGAEAGWGRSKVALAASNGFTGSYE